MLTIWAGKEYLGRL